VIDAEKEIRVLHVDDEPDFCDLASAYLQRLDDRFTVETATGATAGLSVLEEASVDCVVSDYEMPDRNGIEFLQAVRETHPDLPFVLFTGKGSEEIASEAISAGVSDYLQKGGSDTYVLLANRIRNLVGRSRSREAVAAAQERFRLLVEESSDVILVVGKDGIFEYASPAAEQVLGRAPEALLGTSGFELVHPDDLDEVVETFGMLAAEPGRRARVEFRYERPDGTWIWAEARGRNLLDTPAIQGIVVYARDVTERRNRDNRFRAVFERAADAMLITDDDGDYIDANEAACELLGRSRSDLLGMRIDDITPDGVDIEDQWERFKAGELTRGVVKIEGPDGETNEVEFSATQDIVAGEHLSILRPVSVEAAD
jgi:PAS domain S-box-containing protein